MTRPLCAWLACVLAICVLDFLWLGLVARDFYRTHIGALLAERPNWPAAALFYLVYAAGVVYFAVMPAHDTGSWPRAAVHGVLLGLLCYATYDLTNLATLRGWPVVVAAVDIAWGALVTAIAASAGYAAARLA